MVDEIPDAKPASYLAPSFPWVSMDRSVIYSLPYRSEDLSLFGQFTVKFLGGHTTTSDANPIRSVSSRYMCVFGLVQPLQLRYRLAPARRKLHIKRKFAEPETTDFYADTYLSVVKVLGDQDNIVTTANRATTLDDCFIAEVEVASFLVADRPHWANVNKDSTSGIADSDSEGSTLGYHD